MVHLKFFRQICILHICNYQDARPIAVSDRLVGIICLSVTGTENACTLLMCFLRSFYSITQLCAMFRFQTQFFLMFLKFTTTYRCIVLLASRPYSSLGTDLVKGLGCCLEWRKTTGFSDKSGRYKRTIVLVTQNLDTEAKASELTASPDAYRTTRL